MIPVTLIRSTLNCALCSTLSLALGLGSSVALAAPPEDSTADPEVVEVSAEDKSKGEALSDEAIEAFNAKRYKRAANLFQQAYDVDPQPNYLFNIGRVYEEAGRLEDAVAYYGDFVKQPGVDLDSRGVALDRLKVLRAIIEETNEPEPEAEPDPEPEVEPESPVDEPDPEPDPAAVEDARKRKVMRGAGFGLVGVGVGALIGGAVLGGLAQGDSGDAEQAGSIEDRRDFLDSSKTKALTADLLYGAGGALLLVGVVLVVVGYKKPKASSRVAFTPTFGPTGVGADFQLRF